MKICNLPKLLNEAYENNKGLGKFLKKSGSNKKAILINFLMRMPICVFFALASLGAGKGVKNFNWNAMYVMDGIMSIYVLFPFIHLLDKVMFYQYGVVYKCLIIKKTFCFAEWKPKFWQVEFTPFLGKFKSIEGEKFLFSKLNYTYINNFFDDFLSFYLNYIKIKLDNNVNYRPAISVYEDRENYVFTMAAYGESFIKYAARHMLHEPSSYEGKLNIVYAHYFEMISSRTSKYYYYIIGIGEYKIYIVPFIAGQSGIGYGDGYCYELSKLGYIKRNGKDYKEQFYELKSKKNETCIKFFVNAQNQVLWGNPFKISQEREAEAFYNSMTKWIEQL